MNHATKYQWLDFLRGVCALLVCAGHLRAAMFVDHAALHSSSMFTKVFYLATGLGHQSVIVFFVLSGFFVGGSVLRSGDNFKFPGYLVSRLTRLWVVLIPALVLTFVVDRIIGGIDPGILHGAGLPYLNSGPDGQYSDSAPTLFNNLIFLQTINAPVFGSNGPLWSLSNEFWYYMAFPFMFLMYGKTRAASKTVFFIALALILIFPLHDKLGGFVAWLMGAAVFAISRSARGTRSTVAQCLALIGFVATFVLSKANAFGLSEQLDAVFLGAGASLLIWALCHSPAMPAPMAPTVDFLSRISYTLYLVHFPLVLLLYTTLFTQGQLQPNAAGYLQFAAVLGCLVLFSYGMWFLFEKRTDRLKRWVLDVGQKFQAKMARP